MAEEIDIPVCFCKTCDCNTPVYIHNFQTKAEILKVIVCPICDSILNKNGAIEITYYPVDQIEKITKFKGVVNE